VTKLIKYIKNEIVVPSGDAINFCVKEYHITEENARKRIERLPDDICKFKKICRDGQSILYDRDKWNTECYFEKLIAVLKRNATQHFTVVNALRLHYGSMPLNNLASYSNSPVEKIKGHKLFETIIADLSNIRLVEKGNEQYFIRGCDDVLDIKSKAINTIQNIVLQQFHEWARNTGFISYNSAKFHSVFSGYQFGLVAPSYIKSLTGKTLKNEGKSIPAFVIADVLLNKEISKDDVDFFVRKIQNVSMQKQLARFIPFLIIGSHDSEIYNVLKTNGIVVGNIDELFGTKYSETIYGIFNLMYNAGAILKKNPEQYLKLLSEIEKIASGITYNLKGDLFEMAVGYFHAQLCQNLDISKNIIYDGEKKEIDVYAVYQEKVVFAECKGLNSPIDDDYIETWLSKKIPHFRKWALQCDSLQNKRVVFEIWCTGGFSDISREKIAKAKQNTHKYDIDFFDIAEMKVIAKEKNIPHFKEILDRYYVN